MSPRYYSRYYCLSSSHARPVANKVALLHCTYVGAFSHRRIRSA